MYFFTRESGEHGFGLHMSETEIVLILVILYIKYLRATKEIWKNWGGDNSKYIKYTF